MLNASDLESHLNRIDGKQYPQYKDIRGKYDFGNFILSIDRIQGDPFAAPSRLSLAIEHSESKLPKDLFSNRSRKTGTETYLAKRFSKACQKSKDHSGSGKSGLIAIDTPGQEIIERTCISISESRTVARFSVGLPASGRRILGRAATKLLVEQIPSIVEQALCYANIDSQTITSYADTNEDADILRSKLEEHSLIAFVAKGSVFPRATGVDQRPLENAIKFASPPSLSQSFELPHAGTVIGMGIPKGVTLIVGGGYHGKSTLLNAIERGVYNHCPGDGRELVVTLPDATKVRAEDGRSVANVDLSPFINNLPGGKDTQNFTTENASGSTSQATSIIETLETGCKTLLIDEDISATNFLIRDQRMQKLIAPDKEPITPFSDRVEALYSGHNTSTLIVLGGSSAYFEAADCVIAMDNYTPLDVTAQAKELCDEGNVSTREPFSLHPGKSRYAKQSAINPYKAAAPYRGRRPGSNDRPPRLNIKAQGTQSLTFGSNEIDLSLLSQIIDPAQTRTIGAALAYAVEENLFETQSLVEALKTVIQTINENGITILNGYDLATIRLQELTATLNRLRALNAEYRR
ncbi:ABC-ATPase domain-containing protein [Puniceicoccaceae bacterium K14]|nr:ABC-ATPase domain-containing protein [Puniceicoccaceae bacterium K14]